MTVSLPDWRRSSPCRPRDGRAGGSGRLAGVTGVKRRGGGVRLGFDGHILRDFGLLLGLRRGARGVLGGAGGGLFLGAAIFLGAAALLFARFKPGAFLAAARFLERLHAGLFGLARLLRRRPPPVGGAAPHPPET